MKSQLDSCVLTVRDMTEQPGSKFVLFVTFAGDTTPHAFSVDSATQDEKTVTGTRYVAGAGNEEVIVFPVAFPWQLISRSALDIDTVRATLERSVAEKDELKAVQTRLRQVAKDILGVSGTPLQKVDAQGEEDPSPLGGYM